MKKVLKITCILLTVIMTFYSVPHLPVVAEDAGSANSALLYDKAFMGVGERCNFDWLINIDSYYFTVTNTSVADYDETNRSYIIGKAPGTTNVTLTYIEGGVIKYASFQLEVMEQANLSNGNYHFKSCLPSKRYLLYPDTANLKATFYRYTNDIYTVSTWTLSNAGNDQYVLFSPTRRVYIGIQQSNLQDNAEVALFPTTYQIIPHWKIYKNIDGNYLLVPDCGQETNLVLTVPLPGLIAGVPLILTNYYNYTDSRHHEYRVWEVYNEIITIDSYYDGTIPTNSALYNLFPEVNNFVINAYQNALGIQLIDSNTYNYHSSIASACPTGRFLSCAETCSSDCADHHKNINNILINDVENIPRDNSHIVVLWMNRPLGVHCETSNNGHAIKGGVGAKATQPGSSIAIFTISDSALNNTTPESWKTTMSISLLAHELAHTFGLPEQYYDNSHCMENNEKTYFCCMEGLYYNEDMQEFYNKVLQGEADIFCPDCLELMESFKHKL